MNHFKTSNDPHPPILELVFSVGENSEKVKNSSYLLNKNGNVHNWPHKTDKKNGTRKNTLRTKRTEQERTL